MHFVYSSQVIRALKRVIMVQLACLSFPCPLGSVPGTGGASNTNLGRPILYSLRYYFMDFFSKKKRS